MSAVRIAIPAAVALAVAANRLGHTYGATAAERAAPLPGDDLVASAKCVCTHATTIAAPPQAVWPWLVQLGWHRGGWYTARWVDRLLFPANRASAREIVPELQHLRVGEFIPDGPPETECGFRVVELVPETTIVLRSDSHLPLSWRTLGLGRLDWTWTFALHPADNGAHTRFVFRWRAETHPWWLRALCEVAVVPADLMMSRDMLRGVKARAEGRPDLARARPRRRAVRRRHGRARALHRGRSRRAARQACRRGRTWTRVRVHRGSVVV